MGLTDEQFEILAKQPNQIQTIKTSRRDFGYVLSKKLNGGTTVAGTVVIANLVGIETFATGAIGNFRSIFRFDIMNNNAFKYVVQCTTDDATNTKSK